MYLRISSIAVLFFTLLCSCNDSDKEIQLPSDAMQSTVNFDKWASDRGFSLTAKLAEFTINRSEDCEYSFDCSTKTINLPNNERFDEELAYQAFAKCLLGRDLEDAEFHGKFLSSIMQVKFDQCAEYECSRTIPFFGIYKEYYIDELFDQTVDINDYELIHNITFDDLPMDSLSFDNCDEISDFDTYHEYLLSYNINPISIGDSIRFTNLISFSDVQLTLNYLTGACEPLVGVMNLDESFKRKYYYLGDLDQDINVLLSDGFTISYYIINGRLSIFINEDLVQSIETGMEELKNMRSWISSDQADTFGNNCNLFELGSYKK